MRSGDVFAGYVIERELGRGGMGSVYLAKHPRLPRMTALKLLNQEMFADDEIRARFIREADLVARLDHPNIVTVYDRGDEGEQLWISMQFIDGVNASSISPGALPPLRAAQIITETAKALDYAHGLGVLHRDVKPANILLARSSSKTGAGERVYLTDFGIARLRDDTGHLTQTGTVTATLAYASPRTTHRSPLDGRSDQYSLACTLFQLLTGAVPFEGTRPAAVIRGHLQQPPPLASPRRAALPPAIDAVLAKALSKRPADRYRLLRRIRDSRRTSPPGSPHPHPTAPTHSRAPPAGRRPTPADAGAPPAGNPTTPEPHPVHRAPTGGSRLHQPGPVLPRPAHLGPFLPQPADPEPTRLNPRLPESAHPPTLHKPNPHLQPAPVLPIPTPHLHTP
ncbi:serine/threonine-protein kinase, partial [Nocardia seriolae]|uniref:serine/threonine-protein kinase n=2 Tax=Nocardia seriolae TaxID=37332 RepID=UPI002158C03D